MKAKVWTIQVYNEEKPKVFVKIDIIKDTKKGFFFFPHSGSHLFIVYSISMWKFG